MTDVSLLHFFFFLFPLSFPYHRSFATRPSYIFSHLRSYDFTTFFLLSLSLSRAFLLFSLLSLFLALPPVFSPTPAFTSRLWILLSNTYIARTAIRTLDDVCVYACVVCVHVRVRSLTCERERARVLHAGERKSAGSHSGDFLHSRGNSLRLALLSIRIDKITRTNQLRII